jgi:hypothetical protein
LDLIGSKEGLASMASLNTPLLTSAQREQCRPVELAIEGSFRWKPILPKTQ